MAYDESLANRVRNLLPSVTLREGEAIGETKMFGGLCFTLNGKMLVGVDKLPRLVVRIREEDYNQELAEQRVQPMDFTGKPLKNFAFVPESSFKEDSELIHWVEQSAEYVREFMLKPKSKKK